MSERLVKAWHCAVISRCEDACHREMDSVPCSVGVFHSGYANMGLLFFIFLSVRCAVDCVCSGGRGCALLYDVASSRLT